MKNKYYYLFIKNNFDYLLIIVYFYLLIFYMPGTVFQKSKTPSYPNVRGRLDSFYACVPSSREVSVSGLPLQGDKRGSSYILSAIACGGMLLRHG